MSIKVSKFGGTSLCDADAVLRAAAIIRADDARRAIVVSAPGRRSDDDEKITDLLLRLISERDARGRTMDIIASRFLKMAEELCANVDISSDLDDIISALDKGDHELLISRGEWICARLVASVIGYEAVDAARLILTNERGEPLCEETFLRICTHCGGKCVVIPGFYGALTDGRIKTFPRGGSDITGAVVAAALGADVYENFTDVNGFLFADPRIVNDPPVIKKMTYSQARFLSRFGANVLHESTVLYTKNRNIPINIKNSFVPSLDGTMIVPDSMGDDCEICGISSTRGYTMLVFDDILSAMEMGERFPDMILSSDMKSALVKSDEPLAFGGGKYRAVRGIAVLAAAGNARKAALFDTVRDALFDIGAKILFMKTEHDGLIVGIDEKYAVSACRAVTEAKKRGGKCEK